MVARISIEEGNRREKKKEGKLTKAAPIPNDTEFNDIKIFGDRGLELPPWGQDALELLPVPLLPTYW